VASKATWHGTAVCHKVMTIHAVVVVVVVEDIAAEAVVTIMVVEAEVDEAGAEVAMAAAVEAMVVAAAIVEVRMYVTIVVNKATFLRIVLTQVLEDVVVEAALVMDKAILVVAIPVANLAIYRVNAPSSRLIDAVAVVVVLADHQNVTTARKSGIWHVNALRAMLEVATTDKFESYVVIFHRFHIERDLP